MTLSPLVLLGLSVQAIAPVLNHIVENSFIPEKFPGKLKHSIAKPLFKKVTDRTITIKNQLLLFLYYQRTLEKPFQ